ncbi:MAG: nitrous oxide-stimulated promoter family protein [Candidatus Omnitrophica bacterium]|nr:nitrous oxide-stimulated promoter family protein [Candidatus Omnitrophota bacterium]
MRLIDPESVKKDLAILNEFVRIFCKNNHERQTGDLLCDECRDLLDYARGRLAACPYDPKPKCKHCLTHCYRLPYREKMKAVMRFSGMYFVKRGRIDWLLKYFFIR